VIEHLPGELRDRFTDMREIDLSVQNRVDSLGDRQKTFFANCTRKPKAGDREEEYEKIRGEYKKVIEDSNEKINVAEECYGLVDRYLRKLDEELLKFKLELEADNRGITEILEKQSLEMDAPATIPLKENRLPKKIRKQPQAVSMMPQHQQIAMDFMSPSIRLERGMDYDPSFGTASMSSVASSSNSMVGGPVGAQAATPSFPLQHIGVGGNAIAAAASQAIAATQQLSGRRSSSLKASFEAIHLGVQANEFSIGRELAGAAQAAIASTSFENHQPSVAGPTKKSKKKAPPPAAAIGSDLMNSPGGYLDVLGGGQDSSNGTDQEWSFDPHEPRYCICNQVSYGDMVACDNDDVSL
jgi:inhibitor of growth protein 3